MRKAWKIIRSILLTILFLVPGLGVICFATLLAPFVGVVKLYDCIFDKHVTGTMWEALITFYTFGVCLIVLMPWYGAIDEIECYVED